MSVRILLRYPAGRVSGRVSLKDIAGNLPRQTLRIHTSFWPNPFRCRKQPLETAIKSDKNLPERTVPGLEIETDGRERKEGRER